MAPAPEHPEGDRRSELETAERQFRERLYRSEDIDVVMPDGPLPVSRGGIERRLARVNRYDRRAEVVSYQSLTETGTVSIWFRVHGDELFAFRPGQFIGIQADLPAWGIRISPYCIVSPPNEERTFELLVRLVPEGPLSGYLASLSVGDVIRFRGPMGRSMMPKEDDTDLVMLATGVGIGPLLAFAEHVLPRGFQRPIQILWGLRLVEDVCLLDRLEALAGRYGNFSYRICLSQPDDQWTGNRGRLTDTAPTFVGEVGGKHFYLVGNGAMIEEIRCALSELGVSRKLIHEERYFNIRHEADPGTVARIREGFVARELDTAIGVMDAIESTVNRWRARQGG